MFYCLFKKKNKKDIGMKKNPNLLCLTSSSYTRHPIEVCSEGDQHSSASLPGVPSVWMDFILEERHDWTNEATWQRKPVFSCETTIHSCCVMLHVEIILPKVVTKQETYHNSQGLQNIKFAHRTGTMFTKPGIHTGLVKNMPIKKIENYITNYTLKNHQIKMQRNCMKKQLVENLLNPILHIDRPV